MTPYDYRVVEVIRVVDGDTLDAVLDLGLRVTTAQRFRLLGCDTPERSEAGWRECTMFTREWMLPRVTLRTLRGRTHKADSFGRWLIDLYDELSGDHLSTELVSLMAVNGWTSEAVR